ncbi:MAG: 6,7-dimethyl-8-ribityllumazine synthase [Candidatus Woesearchaeota archaeon]|jgi:6,7-dimethyl-8-ribityllumazine synthase
MKQINTIHIGIIVADFNQEITHPMLKIAESEATKHNITYQVVHVPGVFDMPLIIKKLLQKKDIEGVVTLGAVISGGTAHDAHVAENAARQISNLSLEFEKPVTLSIIGHTVSKQQALERHADYAKYGIEAILKLITTLKKIEHE